jgi:cyclopropane-fatty-acyl-phospholipid synthase
VSAADPPTLAAIVAGLLGDDLPIRFEFYDGSAIGPLGAPATVVVRRPEALARILYAPGELGVARAYVAGDLAVDGDLREVLALRERMPVPRFTAADRLALVRALGRERLRPLPPPPEEVRLRGRLHSWGREADAISHHYDVSNEFYELLLGPSMTYTCALWSEPGIDLARAQWLKYELVCRKLDLRPGMHLLDCGSGWGGMALHAAREHGVTVTAVTLSELQVEWARKAVAEAGLADRVDIRYQDYRAVDDGPYDAISSIGMFEHVGSDLARYPATMFGLLRPGGRFVHHAVSRPPFRRRRLARPTFLDRYVFPDADLHEIGTIVSAIQAAGFEARHMESLRDHYPPTISAWLDNLEGRWDEAVSLIGEGRARVWQLYLAAAQLGLTDNRVQIHQVVAVRPDHGRSGFSRQPGDWVTVQPAGETA